MSSLEISLKRSLFLATVLLLMGTTIPACGNSRNTEQAPIGYEGDLHWSDESERSINSPRNDLSKGGDTMTTENVLVRPVDSHPNNNQPAHTNNQSSKVYQEISGLPEAARLHGGSVLIPQYVPDGFSLQQIKSTRDRQMLSLEYRKADGPASLMISIGGGIVPTGLPVKRGHSEQVEVTGASDTQFIRGMWLASIDGGEVSWHEDVSLRLIFHRGDELIMILGIPGNEWSKEEIVLVANSLEIYQQPAAP